MSIYDLASYNSSSRGYDYYKNNKIKTFVKVSENEYDATVQGNSLYKVHLDLLHPRNSTCTCPFAKGKKICKHMLAVYFKANPEFAKNYEDSLKTEYFEAKKYLEKRNSEFQSRWKECKEQVDTLSIEEIKEKLISYMVHEYDCYNEQDDYYEDIYYSYHWDFEDEEEMFGTDDDEIE